jgi:AcrR family transcriptional regulator
MTRGDKRHQIMLAAEKLFTSRRFHEITMEDVAQAARVGKGTIYMYFQDKDDLFFQMASAGFDEMCDILQRRVPGDAPFQEQLLSACAEIARFFERRRQLLGVQQAEELRMSWSRGKTRDRWMAQREKLVATVAAILSRGAAEGKVRPDYPPEVLANLLLGLLRARGKNLASAAERHRSDFALVDLFLQGAGMPDRTVGPKATGSMTRNEV